MPAGKLGFSVLVYLIQAFISIFIIFLRRRFVGGELGGSGIVKKLNVWLFIFQWVL